LDLYWTKYIYFCCQPLKVSKKENWTKSHPMTMKKPPHPGEIIRELCLEPLGLTITRAAQGLGVTRKTLSMLVNGHAAGISPEMAVRLSQAFGRSPESWLQLQVHFRGCVLRTNSGACNAPYETLIHCQQEHLGDIGRRSADAPSLRPFSC